MTPKLFLMPVSNLAGTREDHTEENWDRSVGVKCPWMLQTLVSQGRGTLITYEFCACYKSQYKHIKGPIRGETKAALDRINGIRMPALPDLSRESITFKTYRGHSLEHLGHLDLGLFSLCFEGCSCWGLALMLGLNLAPKITWESVSSWVWVEE